MPEHTPTPWRQWQKWPDKIRSNNGLEIATCHISSEDAAFIVKAVNYHERLVELLDEYVRANKGAHIGHCHEKSRCWICKARVLLAEMGDD